MTIKVVDNKEKEEKIRKAIRENGGYCVCSLIRDDRHKCICQEFIEREEDGWCRCGLYYKTNDKSE